MADLFCSRRNRSMRSSSSMEVAVPPEPVISTQAYYSDSRPLGGTPSLAGAANELHEDDTLPSYVPDLGPTSRGTLCATARVGLANGECWSACPIQRT